HLVLAHPLVVVQLGEVALAGVAEEGDDQRVGIVDAAGDAEGDVGDEAGGAADEEPLLAGEPAGHGEGVAVGDGDVVVDHAAVEGGRPLVLADALDLVRPPRLRYDTTAPRPGQDGADRVAGDDLDLRVALLEVAADAGDRAARARRGDEMGDAPFRLLPQL